MSSTVNFGNDKPACENEESKTRDSIPKDIGTSQLNPADIHVNQSMPKYSVPFSFTSKPPMSDEDIAEGKPLRIAARKKPMDALKGEVSDQKRVKHGIKQGWNFMTETERQAAQRVLDFFNKQPEYLDYFNFLKTEIVWWDNNPELSPREVTTRDTQFDEKLEQKITSLQNARNAINTSVEATLLQEQREAQQIAANRTLYDDFSDSMTIMGKVIFWLVYILVGLRCASFAANEIMYKPLPYRVLVFFYTFLFAPVFGPYYLWIIIKRFIWKTPSPMYEGFFPMNPYDPSDPLTLNRRLFGYANTPELRKWMDEQRQQEEASRDAAVVSKNIKQQIIQQHSR